MSKIAGFLMIFLLMGMGVQNLALADDDTCMAMPCLGKCMNKEEAMGRAFPMYCTQQVECYKAAECKRQDDGNCAWTKSSTLEQCLEDHKQNGWVKGAKPAQ